MNRTTAVIRALVPLAVIAGTLIILLAVIFAA